MKYEILNPLNLFKIPEFQNFIKKKGIISRLLNYYFSSLLHFIFRFQITTKILNLLRKSIDLKKINQYWIIRIGFTKHRNFLPFINMDPYLSNLMSVFFTKMPYFCSNLKFIPINNNSCQMIHIKHFFEYFKQKNYEKTLENWYHKLILEGILKITLNLKKNKKK